MKKVRARLTYPHVVSTLALFLALGGTAWALGANSVGSRQIKPNAVKTSDLAGSAVKDGDIASNAVSSPKIADATLLRADFAAGQVPPAAGRIHSIGSEADLTQVAPGLAYNVSCFDGTPDLQSVRFWPQPAVGGTANAMVVGHGVETPSNDGNTVNVANGAQAQGFPFTSGQQVWVTTRNDAGVAGAEMQLIMDIGPRTYSVALHTFMRASDAYCETIGTVTLAQP